jgi:hypothetical protein
MNSQEALAILIEKELEQYPEKDVLVYYQREHLHLTYGFFVWTGHVHEQTTLSELLQDGFEKSDVKELRADASKFLVVEFAGKFKVKHGKSK